MGVFISANLGMAGIDGIPGVVNFGIFGKLTLGKFTFGIAGSFGSDGDGIVIFGILGMLGIDGRVIGLFNAGILGIFIGVLALISWNFSFISGIMPE